MDHNSKSSAHADLEGRRFAPPSNQAGWRDERKTARGSATSTAGNQAVQRLLQERAILPKLEIGSPNDPQEREAEDAAECLANGIPCNNCIGPSFHRFPASPLSPKNNPGATAGPASAAEDFVPRSGGRPLEPAVRAEMEASFGEDFSAVRVHTGGEAAASAKSIRALAYTAGSDVVFDSGRYAPETGEGRKLLAHELAHVTQQEENPDSNTVRRYCDPTTHTCLPGTERPWSSAAEAPAGEILESTLPAGPIYHFEGIALAEDAEYVYRQLTQLVLDYRDAGAAASFAERLRRFSSADIESERRRAEDYRREGTLPGGVPLPAAQLEEQEALLAVKDRIQPIVDAAAGRIHSENQVSEHQIETMARANLSEALSISEERALGERGRYGLTPERTEYRPTRGDYGEHALEISSYTPAGMASNAATAGLAAAARRLLGEVRSIRALVAERNGLRQTVCSEVDCETTITDPARFERVNRDLEERRRQYALARNEVEADYPILAAYTTIESDAYIDIDGVIDDLNTIASGRSPSAARMLYGETEETLNNIRRVREAVRDGDLSVWDLPNIIALTRDQLGIRDDARMGIVLRSRMQAAAQAAQNRVLVDLAIGLVALVLGLIAAIPSGGSSLVAAGTFIAAVGAAGVSGYMAVTHAQEYLLQAAMNGTDFDKARAISQEEPSLFWVALDIVGAITDLHGALAAFRALRGTVRAALEARRAGNVVEAEQQIRRLVADAESHAPGRNLGRRISDHLAGETGHMRAPDLLEWQRGLNPETRAFLVDNPATRSAYETMSPAVRQILTNCSSLCVIPNLTRPQIHEVQQLLDRLLESGAALDGNIMIQLKIYFHIQQEDFPRALRLLRGVNTVEDLERQVLQGFRRRAMAPLGPAPAATPRNIAGTVSGGARLPPVRAGEDWLRASTRGRIGLIPEQIATQLRGQTFNNFDEFRAAFWQAVENDPVLSSGFNQANRTLMQSGLAPFGPGGQYQLHHITPLENGGPLYDLDNLMVVSDEFHISVHSTIPLNP